MPRFRACEPRIRNTLFENSAHLCYQTSSEKGAGRVDLGVRFCCTPAWWMKKTNNKDSSATHPRRPEETQDDEHNNSLQAFLKFQIMNTGCSLCSEVRARLRYTYTHTRGLFYHRYLEAAVQNQACSFPELLAALFELKSEELKCARETAQTERGTHMHN